MSSSANTRTPPTKSMRWLVPTGLILLSLIPIISGSLRVTELAGGPEVLPHAERFSVFPLPVITHIVTAALFSILGAFQFLPGLRRGRRSWHMLAGRVLIPAGLLVALSGLWMAAFSDLPAGDGPLLLVLRIVFGTYMVVSIVLGVRAIIGRRFAEHGAWMTRAYALGVAAGTQAILLIPVSIIAGSIPASAHEVVRALVMGLAWLVNLTVAEFAIRRRARQTPRKRRAAAPVRTSVPRPSASHPHTPKEHIVTSSHFTPAEDAS
ncbi:DUF2306 domain-containing protein [Microbacterium flavescens]|uniref:DUF2306 domain-containing protein n=1 Tax=Microbacterium flavescens TaxID=69366 RepID=UPI001BDF2C19|nr:DUF2306 domain-containing protein [Microbacterium flavescens]